MTLPQERNKYGESPNEGASSGETRQASDADPSIDVDKSNRGVREMTVRELARLSTQDTSWGRHMSM